MPDSSFHLQEPVLTGGLVAPRFFNGRLLSGDALTQLQDFEQGQRRRLGAVLGAGVADGLWVEPVGTQPRLRVRAGEALDGQGEVLRLPQDIEIDLSDPPASPGAATGGAGFQARPPSLPSGGASAVPGVFVLVAGLTRQPRGRAPVSAGTTANGPCNVREDAEGVVFRAAPVVSSQLLQPSSARFRGDVAALCFGLGPGLPHRAPTERVYGPPCLLPADALAPSEVALAVFRVAGGSVAFVDNWAVRRRVAARFPMDPSGALYGRIVGDEQRALMEAMAFHFQERLTGMNAPTTARDVFAWLPPAGVIPSTHAAGGGWRALLGELAPGRAREVTLETLQGLLDEGLERRPIDLSAEHPVPVDVYAADGGLVIFARSTKARLRGTGPTSAEGAVLAARPVDPDEHERTLEDGWRRAVGREVGDEAVCTLDLEAGTYEVSVDEGESEFVELKGGETRQVDLKQS